MKNFKKAQKTSKNLDKDCERVRGKATAILFSIESQGGKADAVLQALRPWALAPPQPMNP